MNTPHHTPDVQAQPADNLSEASSQEVIAGDSAAQAGAAQPVVSTQWTGRRHGIEVMPPVIALLTDFGTADPYVAQMKGAILRRAPNARLVDVTHAVQPYHLEQAGFLLQASCNHFPRGTVFLAVVDPGVGTARRIICLSRDGRMFLAPDNGLLTPLLEEPGQALVHDLTPSAEAIAGASATFHARDIMGPLAARLAEGTLPAEIGREVPLEEAVRLKSPAAQQVGEALHLRVLHVDRFGNCILNAEVDPWLERLLARQAEGRLLQVALEGETRRGLQLVRTYAELQDPATMGLLAGSQGYLELALDKASAAAQLGLRAGDFVRICFI
ncbi:SAM hydrolase/SAM-dependent halogenase family protein [Megalodesulfovibrio paquesii]